MIPLDSMLDVWLREANDAIALGTETIEVNPETLTHLINDHRAQATELARLRDLERQCAPALPGFEVGR